MLQLANVPCCLQNRCNLILVKKACENISKLWRQNDQTEPLKGTIFFIFPAKNHLLLQLKTCSLYSIQRFERQA